jgi:hypothetical protein
LKDDGEEIEVGSIGVQFDGWHWGIDNVIPMREQTARARTARNCMRQFRAAWERFGADPTRLTEFTEMKRKATPMSRIIR